MVLCCIPPHDSQALLAETTGGKNAGEIGNTVLFRFLHAEAWRG
jgi:hypothetical protein